MNTSGAENSFFISPSGDYAYFDSNYDTQGASDIFRIQTPVLQEEDNKKETSSPVISLSGKILNPITQEPITANILFQDAQTGELISEIISDQVTGQYSVNLPLGKIYKVTTENPAFFSLSKEIDLNSIFDHRKVANQTLYMIPSEGAQTFRLNNLFFDTNSATLKKDAFADLGRLAIFLNQYASVKLEISGHADNTGSPTQNQILSKQRADAVMQYLVSVGIAPERIISKGYGITKPLVDNTTEENKAINRRVEFSILEDE